MAEGSKEIQDAKPNRSMFARLGRTFPRTGGVRWWRARQASRAAAELLAPVPGGAPGTPAGAMGSRQ